MKSYGVLLTAILALVAGSPRLHRVPHELTEADQARVQREVTAFLASYLEAIEGDDTEAIRGLFVDDGRFAWFTDGEKRYTSADQVLASLAGMEGMTLATDSSKLEVIPLTPDLSHARSAFRTRIIQDGAVVYEYGGVITWLLEEVEDGEWRVLTGHTSTPKPR